MQELQIRRHAKQNNKAVSSPKVATNGKKTGKQQKKRVTQILPSDSLVIFTEKQPMPEEDSDGR